METWPEWMKRAAGIGRDNLSRKENLDVDTPPTSIFQEWVQELSYSDQLALAQILRNCDYPNTHIGMMLKAITPAVLRKETPDKDPAFTATMREANDFWVETSVSTVCGELSRMPLAYVLDLTKAIIVITNNHPEERTRKAYAVFYLGLRKLLEP